MTDDQWEAWEEWLAHDQTQRFLSLLRGQAKILERAYKEGLYHYPQDPATGDYPHLRAKSMIYWDLSEIGRSKEARTEIEGMMDDEHDGD